MTSVEIGKLFEYLDTMIRPARNNDHRIGYKKFKMFCEVLLNTGMRRSEPLNLTMDHIDFPNNVVRWENTKGNKRQEVPMTDKVCEILLELAPVLFRDMTKAQVTHKFTRCAKEIELKGVKLHSLRHTLGTYLIAMGYDTTVVKELLGHEDIKTTMIYAKADNRLPRDAIRSFGKLGRSGYKMVTKDVIGDRMMLEEKTPLGNGDNETTYSARRGT